MFEYGLAAGGGGGGTTLLLLLTLPATNITDLKSSLLEFPDHFLCAIISYVIAHNGKFMPLMTHQLNEIWASYFKTPSHRHRDIQSVAELIHRSQRVSHHTQLSPWLRILMIESHKNEH